VSANAPFSNELPANAPRDQSDSRSAPFSNVPQANTPEGALPKDAVAYKLRNYIEENDFQKAEIEGRDNYLKKAEIESKGKGTGGHKAEWAGKGAQVSPVPAAPQRLPIGKEFGIDTYPGMALGMVAIMPFAALLGLRMSRSRGSVSSDASVENASAMYEDNQSQLEMGLPAQGSPQTTWALQPEDDLATAYEDDVDTAYAVLRDTRLANRKLRQLWRLGNPSLVNKDAEYLASRLSPNDVRLLPASSLARFNIQLREWSKALAGNVLADVRAVHLHVGAGRLGLGLVLPAIMKSDRPCAILQRPSKAWAQAVRANRVNIRVNGEVIADLQVVETTEDLDSAMAAQEKAILVLSEDPAVLSALVAHVGSFSCSLGGQDLLTPLAPLVEAIDKVRKDAAEAGLESSILPFYACENDHEAVKKLGEALDGRIEVVPVMVDRVCTARDVNIDGSVDVETEPYAVDLVLTPRAGSDMPTPPLPFAGDHVKEPQTREGAAFLHRKKTLLVNGTHTTIAFLTLVQGEPNRVGLPEHSHELLAYDVEKAYHCLSNAADMVGRSVWVWAVARQLMLLHEFDGDVVRNTLGIPSGGDGDDVLIDTLLSDAKIAITRLSAGGDQTSRVLGGGVENRWRTRLANVQEFTQGIWRLDPLSKRLLEKAGVPEKELRSSVRKLVMDSQRFVKVPRPRSLSPSGLATARQYMCSLERLASPRSPARAKGWHNLSPRLRTV
jgi:hypothetical protein